MKIAVQLSLVLILTTLVSSVPAATAASQPAAAKDFTGGRYTIISYKSTDSATHSGKIIIKKQGDIFKMDVNFEDGPPLQGVALYRDGELWAAVGQADTMGLAVYKISAGTLTGTTYNISGDPTKFGSETMTGSKDLAGDYKLTDGKAPFTGDAYSGKAVIHPVRPAKLSGAPVYHLDWTLGDYQAQAAAFKVGDTLIAATSSGPEWAVVRFKIDPATGAMSGDFYDILKAVGTVALTCDGD